MIRNNILINTETRNIKKKDYDFLGVAGENNIEQIVFKLSAFIDGEAILEIEKYNKEGKLETHYFELQKQDESYLFEVKSSLLDVAKDVKMQLHITTANEEVFKSNIFTMKVREAINATNTIPEEYESWIDSANAKIAQMQQLEETVTKKEEERKKSEIERTTAEESRNKAEEERIQNEKARQESETSRATAESTRKKNESDRIINENGRAEAENIRSNEEETRQTNETERIANESARKLAEENREKTTKEAVNNIKDLSASYEQLAEAKKTELNNYTTNLETSLKNKLDTYEEVKEEELDIHKTTLETEMTNTKDTLVQEIETAQNGFDENATLKKIAFNNNVTKQTNTFNNNASTKQTEYDDNATAKLEEYNNNSTTKLAEFNENAESYEKRIADLEQERDEIAEQMPWNTTEITESIHIEDSAKYSRNKLDIFGNLKQETREGYNIIPNNLNDGEINGVKYVVNSDKSVVLNGTATGTVILTLNNLNIQVVPGTYVLSGCPKGGGDNTYKLDIIMKNTVTNAVRYPKDVGSGYTIEVVNDEIITTTRIVVYSGAVLDNLVFKPMLKLKTTKEKPYEQYGAMPSLEYPSMPVVATGVQKIKNLKKNCLDCTKFKTNNYIEVLESTENSIVIKGINKFYTGVYEVFKLKPNTVYTIQSQVDNVGIKSMGKIYIYSSYDSQGIISSTNKIGETNLISEGNTGNIKTTFTTNDTGIVYILFSCNNTTNTGTVTYSNVQLEEGDIATEVKSPDLYELDLGTTELAKITDTNGNVVAQDRFVFKDDKWQIERNVGKMVLDGSESWYMNADRSFNNTNYFAFNYKQKGLSSAKINCVSSNLKTFTAAGLWTNDVEGIAQSQSQIVIRIRNSIDSLNDLKALLSENPTTIYLSLIEATYEDCTTEQSEVLDKLYKLALEKGINNIIVESENGVTTELQLKYMQDNKLLKEQEHKALEDRITALEELLSTTQTSAMLLDNMQSDLESEV